VLGLSMMIIAADFFIMKRRDEHRNIEITADGWFFVAQYNAKLAERCSDTAKAEKLRKRVSDALERLSIFELATLSSSH
jgi:hypothetical protein